MGEPLEEVGFVQLVGAAAGPSWGWREILFRGGPQVPWESRSGVGQEGWLRPRLGRGHRHVPALVGLFPSRSGVTGKTVVALPCLAALALGNFSSGSRRLCEALAAQPCLHCAEAGVEHGALEEMGLAQPPCRDHQSPAEFQDSMLTSRQKAAQTLPHWAITVVRA